MLLSKRQFCLRNGFDVQTLRRYIQLGVVTLVCGKVSDSVTLIEGEHYVICRICGLKYLEVGNVHLRMHGTDVDTYRMNWGECSRSSLSVASRAKTEEEKDRQRKAILRFYETPQGSRTRQHLSAVGKSQTALNEARKETLKNIRDTTPKEVWSQIMKSRWSDPSYRKSHQDRMVRDRDRLCVQLCEARKKLNTTSSFHVRAADLLKPHILTLREYKEGPYSIDEAIPDLKIAIEFDGCYWHGCVNCGYPGVGGCPDSRKNTFLVRRGWVVLRIRECLFRADPTSFVSFVVDSVRSCHAEFGNREQDSRSVPSGHTEGEVRYFQG